jgi:hypothetical protein
MPYDPARLPPRQVRGCCSLPARSILQRRMIIRFAALGPKNGDGRPKPHLQGAGQRLRSDAARLRGLSGLGSQSLRRGRARRAGGASISPPRRRRRVPCCTNRPRRHTLDTVLSLRRAYSRPTPPTAEQPMPCARPSSPNGRSSHVARADRLTPPPQQRRRSPERRQRRKVARRESRILRRAR